MEIFKQEFPADCDVVVRKTDGGGVLVVVRNRRPEPVWLKTSKPAAAVKVKDAEIEAMLLRLVSAHPGRGPSFYCRVPSHLCEVGGSQQRKERMLKQLIREGKLKQHKFILSQGRRTVGIYPKGTRVANGV